MNKPTIDDQKELLSIDRQDFEYVNIPRTNEKVKVGCLKPETITRISELELEYGIDIENPKDVKSVDDIRHRTSFASKIAALILLNGFKINFFYWIYWRYLYYVKGYDYSQLMPIILTGKKKVPSAGYMIAFISASQMSVTKMIMTKEEQKSFQNVLMSELDVPSESSTPMQ